MPLSAEDFNQIRTIVNEAVDARTGAAVWQYPIPDPDATEATGGRLHANTILRKIRSGVAGIKGGSGASAEDIVDELAGRLAD
jgi:hypothetical protein